MELNIMDQRKDDLLILSFDNQQSWEVWLKLHHTEQKGIWLMLAKKSSNISSVTYDEAVESALCYGWIDSQNASFDSQYWLQKFSPRRANSKWSQKNREKAEALIAAGRMQPPGFKQVELAKADGRWEAAYDSQGQISIPNDLQDELDRNPSAKVFFRHLEQP